MSYQDQEPLQKRMRPWVNLGHVRERHPVKLLKDELFPREYETLRSAAAMELPSGCILEIYERLSETSKSYNQYGFGMGGVSVDPGTTKTVFIPGMTIARLKEELFFDIPDEQ